MTALKPSSRTQRLLIGAALWLLAAPAHAVLGGSSASIVADRLHMAANERASQGPTFTIHALTLANGAVTREFARRDGVVFAVTWSGPSRPDLRQLLGGYFEAVQTSSAPTGVRHLRRPLSISHGGMLLHAGGHAGHFRGAAYLPALAPAGFSVADLQS